MCFSLTGQKPRTNCTWHSCEMNSRTSLFDGHIQLTTSIDNTKHLIRPNSLTSRLRTDAMTWPLKGFPLWTSFYKSQITFSLHSWCVISALSARCFIRYSGLKALLQYCTDERGVKEKSDIVENMLICFHAGSETENYFLDLCGKYKATPAAS